MYDTEDFTQEKETENKALRTLPLNVTHQNLSRQNCTIRESTHISFTTLKVLASERKYFTYRTVLVQREDFTKYRPPRYNGTTCALGAERSPSARVRILATVQREIGHPLGVTVPKWVGFQIGGLHEVSLL